MTSRPAQDDAPGTLRFDVLSLAQALSGRVIGVDARTRIQVPDFFGMDGLASGSGAAFAHAAEAGDLDRASALLGSARPAFAVLMDIIRAEGAIARGQADRYLRRKGIRTSAFEANALAKAAIQLGQAYTTLGLIRDGSRRPPAADLASMLREAAEATAVDRLVRVSDLVGPVCSRARISPHALGRAIARDAAIATMAGLHLSSSAGGPVRGRDAVLSWSEDGPRLETVALDRFRVGERPVFVCLLESLPPA